MRHNTIIIVEGDAEMRSRLMHAFEDRGYITWTCPGPEVALSIFSTAHPNVVLLDLDEEESIALGLLDTWKKTCPETRVVVESSFADAERMREAMNLGAYAFLIKPYSLPPLFELLEREIPPAHKITSTTPRVA